MIMMILYMQSKTNSIARLVYYADQRRNWVSDTDPRPDPTRDDSDP